MNNLFESKFRQTIMNVIDYLLINAFFVVLGLLFMNQLIFKIIPMAWYVSLPILAFSWVFLWLFAGIVPWTVFYPLRWLQWWNCRWHFIQSFSKSSILGYPMIVWMDCGDGKKIFLLYGYKRFTDAAAQRLEHTKDRMLAVLGEGDAT